MSARHGPARHRGPFVARRPLGRWGTSTRSLRRSCSRSATARHDQWRHVAPRRRLELPSDRSTPRARSIVQYRYSVGSLPVCCRSPATPRSGSLYQRIGCSLHRVPHRRFRYSRFTNFGVACRGRTRRSSSAATFSRVLTAATALGASRLDGDRSADLSTKRSALEGYRPLLTRAADGIRTAGGFGEPEQWSFEWQRT